VILSVRIFYFLSVGHRHSICWSEWSVFLADFWVILMTQPLSRNSAQEDRRRIIFRCCLVIQDLFILRILGWIFCFKGERNMGECFFLITMANIICWFLILSIQPAHAQVLHHRNWFGVVVPRVMWRDLYHWHRLDVGHNGAVCRIHRTTRWVKIF